MGDCSDVEAVRRGLMMRDAGYGNPPDHWEQVGALLKAHDRLRAAARRDAEEIAQLRERLQTIAYGQAGDVPSRFARIQRERGG